MRQEQFVEQSKLCWQQLDAIVENLEFPPKKSDTSTESIDKTTFPKLYRETCHHLALAKSRGYSPVLIGHLSKLVQRSHTQLYRQKKNPFKQFADFFTFRFPQLVRQEWRCVLFASLLFYIPFFGMLIAIQFNPNLVYSVAQNHEVSSFEEMYDPENERLGSQRDAESDIYMFAYYIYNNTSIGFRTFAGGLFFGIGTLITLFYNGLIIGAVAGHLTHVGFIETFWGFVSGHSAMELTAIVLSGGAGFKLASSFFRPGRKTILRALVDNGKIAMSITMGAGMMFFIAAFIEGFWSSMRWMPVEIKYAVGIFLWVVVIAYFCLQGRRHGSR